MAFSQEDLLTPDAFNAMQKAPFFLSFIGTPRSGHSLVGWLLNGHPNAVVAHEAFLFRRIRLGEVQTHRYGFSKIWECAQPNVKRGLVPIEGLWHGTYRDFIHIVGDKCGGSISNQLMRYNTQFHQSLEWTLSPWGMKSKWIYIIRNPYDNIASMYFLFCHKKHQKKTGAVAHLSDEEQAQLSDQAHRYFYLLEGSRRLMNSQADCQLIYFEDFVDRPRIEIERLCQFLGLDTFDDYLRKSADQVYKSPSETRYLIEWDEKLIHFIENEIKSRPLLKRYRRASQDLHIRD